MGFIQHFFLPFIALVIALLSLFTDVKSIKKPEDILKNRRVMILIACILSSAIINSLYTYADSKEKKDMIDKRDFTISENNREIKKLTSISHNLSKVAAGIKTDVGEILVALQTAEEWGILRPENKSALELVEIFNANQAREEVLSLSKEADRSKISIQYFPKDVDRNKVLGALRELNFSLTTGESKLPNQSTNALFIGSKVDIESVKLIVLTLIRAGVGIQYVGKFTSDKKREYLVQVGGKLSAKDYPLITSGQVSEAKSIEDIMSNNPQKVTDLSTANSLRASEDLNLKSLLGNWVLDSLNTPKSDGSARQEGLYMFNISRNDSTNYEIKCFSVVLQRVGGQFGDVKKVLKENEIDYLISGDVLHVSCEDWHYTLKLMESTVLSGTLNPNGTEIPIQLVRVDSSDKRLQYYTK